MSYKKKEWNKITLKLILIIIFKIILDKAIIEKLDLINKLLVHLHKILIIMIPKNLMRINNIKLKEQHHMIKEVFYIQDQKENLMWGKMKTIIMTIWVIRIIFHNINNHYNKETYK
jgi:hypothetical protein